jgi:hypothetical protein
VTECWVLVRLRLFVRTHDRLELRDANLLVSSLRFRQKSGAREKGSILKSYELVEVFQWH